MDNKELTDNLSPIEELIKSIESEHFQTFSERYGLVEESEYVKGYRIAVKNIMIMLKQAYEDEQLLTKEKEQKEELIKEVVHLFLDWSYAEEKTYRSSDDMISDFINEVISPKLNK